MSHTAVVTRTHNERFYSAVFTAVLVGLIVANKVETKDWNQALEPGMLEIASRMACAAVARREHHMVVEH